MALLHGAAFDLGAIKVNTFIRNMISGNVVAKSKVQNLPLDSCESYAYLLSTDLLEPAPIKCLKQSRSGKYNFYSLPASKLELIGSQRNIRLNIVMLLADYFI